MPTPKFIQGATYRCVPSYIEGVPEFLADQSSVLKTISLHNYPLTHCGKTDPSLIDLMQDFACMDVAQRFALYASDLNNTGKELWIGEMNSASCGGVLNVSDVYGSALWAIDMLFNYANIGVKGVNFHGNGGAYSSLVFLPSPQARPIYYGQYFFAQAIRENSGLLPNTTNNYVKVWSLQDYDSKEVRVIIIHKDIVTKNTAAVTISISRLSVSNSASSVVLEAPSPYSQIGIQLGKQTFDNTTTGAPLGTYTSTPLLALTPGVFQLTVAPATAVLLTIPKA
jgi:hypothetical protein